MTPKDRRKAAERRMWAALKDECDAIRRGDFDAELAAIELKWLANAQASDMREAKHRSKP